MAAVSGMLGRATEALQGRVLLGELLRDGIEPTPQLLEDLLYDGRVHAIVGPPGGGKTMIALWASLRVMEGGSPVVFIDAENGPHIVAERLAGMGADADELDRLFHYHRADLTLEPESIAALRATIENVSPALVVFDSLIDFLVAEGLEENSNTDCAKWYAAVTRPLKEAGVASLVLDHVAKNGKGGPRGGSAKLGAVEVVWKLEVTKNFGRDREVEVELELLKDRDGWLPKTVKFSVGGGVFERSVGAAEGREVSLGGDRNHLTDNASKVYDAMRKAGDEGARHKNLLRAVKDSKGNVTRALEELRGYRLYHKEGDLYFAEEMVPEEPAGKPIPHGTARYQKGTKVQPGTGELASGTNGTTPLGGWYRGTSDARTRSGNPTERETVVPREQELDQREEKA